MDTPPPPPPGTPPVPPPPQASPDEAPPARTMEESDARMWAAFAHLAGLSYVVGVPGILGSLVVWLWKRGEHPFVDEHGREAVNFQITLLVYNVLAVVFVVITCTLGAIVVVPLMAVLGVLIVVLPIIATIQASDGRPYRYPLTIRLLD